MGHPTVADAILDRLVHSAYRIILKGESIRKVIADPRAKEEGAQGPRPGVASLRKG